MSTEVTPADLALIILTIDPVDRGDPRILASAILQRFDVTRKPPVDEFGHPLDPIHNLGYRNV